MDNLGYLFAAYTVIWAVVFGYMLFMHRRQRQLQKQVALLRETLEKTGEPGH